MKNYLHWPRAVSVSYTPMQLASLYKFPKVTASPQKIAIIELGGGYNPTDISAAFSTWGLPAPKLTDVSVDGGRNSPGGDADGEVVLDIEIAAAMYSYCTGKPADVLVFFAPNSDIGFANAVAQAIASGASVVSISWGGPESSWSKSVCQSFDVVCATASLKGVTIFAASGDNDSSDGASGINVDFPASSPHVVGCGGTNKTSASETVWNSGAGEGTGGGFSIFFPLPSWQIGVHGTMRGVPDVAGDADPATGYAIYLNGGWTVVGGTSCVAPLYAGLFAALNGARVAKGLATLNNTLQMIYQAPVAFSDIVQGDNGRWRAGVGWDPCTGLGTAIGTSLLTLLVGTSPNPPTQVIFDEMRLFKAGQEKLRYKLTSF